MLGALFRNAPEPQAENRVINELFGISSSQISNSGAPWLSYAGMMSVPGAFRASMLIADLFSALPWDAYRDYAGNPTEKLTPRPIVLEQPNPQETRAVSITSMVLDYLWHGNAIALVMTRDSNGYPTSYLPVPAEWVSVRRIPYEDNPTIPAGIIEYRIGNKVCYQNDVLHIKGPCRPGALRGMGVLELHCQTLELSRELSSQAADVNMRGVPTGVLTNPNPDITPDEISAAKTSWNTSTTQQTVAVLGGGTTYTPIGWNPDERQLIESRKFSLTEIALIFGVPFSMLGAETGGSMDYTNIETEANGLLKFNLAGHIAKWEQALSLLFPRGTYVCLDRDQILQGDMLSRYKSYSMGFGKWLDAEDIREWERLAPKTIESEPPTDATAQSASTNVDGANVGDTGDAGTTPNGDGNGDVGSDGNPIDA
jgi:HK97 family phage portal protein